jgi:hypothetical protein
MTPMSEIFFPTSTNPFMIPISVSTLNRVILTCSNAAINFVQVLFAPHAAAHSETVSHRSLRTLGNSNFKLRKPVEIVVIESEDGVLAEFSEAEIAVSDDSVPLALAWMKKRIVASYLRFKRYKGKLGPVPTRQLHVMESYIVERTAQKVTR